LKIFFISQSYDTLPRIDSYVMSDTPPKVKEFFVLLGTAALFLAIYGLIVKGGIAQINAVEWLCLGTLNTGQK